jgi:signal transduction histidine kinase
MSRAWTLALLAAIALVIGDVAIAVFWPHHAHLASPKAIGHAAVGGAWLAAGLVSWALRPALHIGALMSAVGFAWLLTSDQWWLTPLPTTVHFLSTGLALAVGIHAVLAFPTGRLDHRPTRVVIAGMYATVLVGNLVRQLFWVPADTHCPQCPRNLLLVDHRPGVSHAIDDSTTVIGTALGLLAVALLVRRWRSASRAGRESLGPVIWTALLATALGIVKLPLDEFAAAPAWLSGVLFYGHWLTIALVPVAFLTGLLRLRMRRAAMTGLMVELGRLPAVDGVRDALARALRDPTLRLVFWQPESQCYIDTDGLPTALPSDTTTHAITVLEHDGHRYGALIHDPFMLEDGTMLEAVGAAGRLAIENARLQAKLRAQLAEVRASRARIVEAGDAERRRIERDLHDGAQQRLLAIRLALRLARERAHSDDAELQTLLTEADEELIAGLDDLRSLAGGIHPAVLTDEGLPAALAVLVRRSTVAVELRAVPGERLPAALEAAVYFVACEALANASKHAHASLVTITVTHEEGRLRLSVSDDGVGGADPMAGSGLRGLADRVQALDGELHVTSDGGGGTTLLADFPCADRATKPRSS